MLSIASKQIPGFNLQLYSIELEKSYYPLSPLSSILGYSTPYSLIQCIPKDNKIDIQELYSLYTIYLDQFQTLYPPTLQQFKKSLVQFKPLWFTDIDGIEYILSKNTFTIPNLKQSIATSLGIKTISPPHKESTFYDILRSLLQVDSIECYRHVYLAGYYVDVEIPLLSIIIEYDENGHKYYNKKKEQEREIALGQLGYTIIRVDDSLNPAESASLVYHKIVSNIKGSTL